MFCPECGTKNAPDAKFCENCGAKLIAPKPAAVTPAAQKIEKIAPKQQASKPEPEPTPVRPVEAEPVVPPVQPAMKQPAKSGGHKKAWLILLALVAIAAIGTGAYYLMQPKKSAQPDTTQTTKKTKKKSGVKLYDTAWTITKADRLDTYLADYGDDEDVTYQAIFASTSESLSGHSLSRFIDKAEPVVVSGKSRPVTWFKDADSGHKGAVNVVAAYLNSDDEVLRVFADMDGAAKSLIVKEQGDHLAMTVAPTDDITKAFEKIHAGEKVSVADNKVAPRWSEDQTDSLSSFMSDWEDSMNQDYTGTYDNGSITIDHVEYPAAFKDGSYKKYFTVNGNSVDLKWAPKADTTAEYQVVAAAIYKGVQGGQSREIVYLYVLHNGTPDVLVNQDLNTSRRNFTSSQNHDLQAGFQQIAAE